MWRNETKADIKAREARAQQEYAKKLGWNPGYQQQAYRPAKVDDGPYVDIGKQSEEAKIREQEREKKEEQDFIRKIASVQDDEKAFTPAELYEAGIEARKEDNGVEATMRLWQALICGDKRAAYPLFEILRDGEAGIPKNVEMAGMFLFIGKQLGSQECKDYKGQSIMAPGLDQGLDGLLKYSALLKLFNDSKEHIVNPNKKITDEILFERQDTADEVLDNFSLKTRAMHQPMLDVFVHPVLIFDNQKHEETALIGEDEADQGCLCIIC